MNPTLIAEAKALADKRAELKTWLDARKSADGNYAIDAQGVEEFNRRNDELNDAAKSYETKAAIAKAAGDNDEALKALNAPANRLPQVDNGQSAFKTLSQIVMESAAYKSADFGRGNGNVGIALNGDALKTLMTTSAGFAPANNRTNTVILSAQRRPVVADLIPSVPTANQIIKYMVETTFTNAAAVVAEGASKPEATLAFTQAQAQVQKIAVTLPVTQEQIMYAPSLQNTLDNRLSLMVQLSEEVELLTGNGTSPHLQGFLTQAGINTYAKGTAPNTTENNADALYRAFKAVRFVGFAEPSGVVIHPDNWTPIRLMKSTQGVYLYGNPDEAGPERVWGKTVVVTPAITTGTALTGDFVNYSEIDRAMDLRVDIGWANDDFLRNQSRIRVEEFLALLIYRASAFSTVTAMDAG